MKTSKLGTDGIELTEENYDKQEEIRKFHLIKLSFDKPTVERVETVLDRFPLTNRYIIGDNIRFYNDMLKARKKYYVENRVGDNLISFFKKNNKVLLNIENLFDYQLTLIENEYYDMLKNVEVLFMKPETFTEKGRSVLLHGSGNVLLQE